MNNIWKQCGTWTYLNFTTVANSLTVSSVDNKMLLRTATWDLLSLLLHWSHSGIFYPFLDSVRPLLNYMVEVSMKSLSLSIINQSSIKLFISALCIYVYLLFSFLKTLKMRMPVNNFKFYLLLLIPDNILCRLNLYFMNLKFLLNNIEILVGKLKFSIVNSNFSSSFYFQSKIIIFDGNFFLWLTKFCKYIVVY